MQRREWLESLKVGDTVAMNVGSFGYRKYVITEITKITPTRRMETKNGYKLGNDGCEMGKKDAWTPTREIVPVTDEILKDIKRSELLFKLSSIKLEKLDTEQLERIYDIVKETD